MIRQSDSDTRCRFCDISLAATGRANMSDPTAGEYVCERKDIFLKLDELTWFQDFVIEQLRIAFDSSRLVPHVSVAALHDAYAFIQKDIRRVSTIEYDGHPLDHFKRCGHLCYWLRRARPIADIETLTLLEPSMLSPKEQRLRKLLLDYGNEYVAFDIGFRICRFFQAKRTDIRTMLLMLRTQPDGAHARDLAQSASQGRTIASFNLEEDYIATMCHVLKEKNVSPHAIHMIYRSLFFEVRTLF